MTAKVALAALAAALALCPATGRSSSPLAPKPDCFWARNINGFRAQSDRVVNVRVGVNDIYQFEIFGTCPDIRWNEQIGIVARGSPYICTGLDADIISPSPIGPQRCPIRNIHKLTPGEIAALPKGAKP